MLSAADFYLADPPTLLQQGDILAGAAILFPSRSRELVVIRSAHQRRPFPDRHLQPGPAELISERALNDAFEEDYEYVATSATRMHVMLITPTCDLADQDLLHWAVWPLVPLKDYEVDEGNLVAGNYANLVRIPDHPYFPPSLVDLIDIRNVSSSSIGLADRVASISRVGMEELTDRLALSFGRNWGYEPGELVPKLAKHETGKFRCARCIMLDIAVIEKQLEVGTKFPECDNCLKLGRSAQWYPVRRHRRY